MQNDKLTSSGFSNRDLPPRDQYLADPNAEVPRRIGESEGPYADTQASHDAFMIALREFYAAGMKLANAWDDGVDFNADALFPLPENLKPPMSLDEWLTELLAHYEEEN